MVKRSEVADKIERWSDEFRQLVKVGKREGLTYAQIYDIILIDLRAMLMQVIAEACAAEKNA